jgi:hypothetical protein
VKTKHLVALFLLAAAALIEFALVRQVDIRVPSEAAGTGVSRESAEAPPPPYDVSHLVRPSKKYLGVTVEGGVNDAGLRAFADAVGRRPNMVALFESFADEFAASQVRKVYQDGGLAMIRWEPFDVPMRDIAAGRHDAYVTRFAKAVRTLNLPIVLTFAHEMNGRWYSWGTRTTKPAEYVAAWRHIHALFKAQEATNVLWTWTPNVINPVPSVKLRPLYPGDAYVDWVGVVGYYTVHGQHSFSDLFGPTIRSVREFTAKPMIIVETGAEPSSDRPDQIKDLLSSVAKSKDVIGVVYFNINGSGRWNIDRDRGALNAFKHAARNPVFGFIVKDLSR